MAKKFIVADNVAVHVDTIFSDGAHLANTALIWWGALCFGIQIYCDFSAYTDIALGSAHLLELTFLKTSKPLMLQLLLKTSGEDGISHCQLGLEIICISH